MMIYKVQGEPNLIKDIHGVVSNNNQDEYMAYMARRNIVKDTKDRIAALENDNKEIKGALAEIIQLLKGKS